MSCIIIAGSSINTRTQELDEIKTRAGKTEVFEKFLGFSFLGFNVRRSKTKL